MSENYFVVVYCNTCERRLGKTKQGTERVDIMCMDCSEEADKKTKKKG